MEKIILFCLFSLTISVKTSILLGFLLNLRKEKYWTTLNDVVCKRICTCKKEKVTVRERIAWTIHRYHISAIGDKMWA